MLPTHPFEPNADVQLDSVGLRLTALALWDEVDMADGAAAA